MSPALLEVQGLHKHFGGVAAVRDTSFTVAEGSITALIGPNGAGKTTMFNPVSRFLRADRGTVRFAGERIERRRADAIARAGVPGRAVPCRGAGGVATRRRRRSASPRPAA
jgi:ABC-type branched-subunit amino acid transport system ATPase component